MVVRNEDGELISCRTSWSKGVPEVKEAEALALFEVLTWMENSGYDKVIFEIDALVVAGAIQRGPDDSTKIGGIMDKCKAILETRPNFSVTVVRRDMNQVAHELAQRSFSLSSPSVWHESPSWLEHALGDICMVLNH
ncbi:hypothetical protein LINPERHAP2_LOCUS942 [Linum perenne]